MWLIGAMVCPIAAPWVQLSVSAGNGWLHNALRHHWLMPISCHFRDCKALLVTSLTHVSGVIASIQTITFTFIKPVKCPFFRAVPTFSKGSETCGPRSMKLYRSGKHNSQEAEF